ncbi:hypothetical protein EAH76_21335 [Sphingomonas glacialis]|uniref:DUF2188 domain-containing protein n=1 Tax=Sphingomonas glacialis TaxID=658225 RepID=A0A502FGI3_9SPHN|nr:hypothetical protein EAH76_21335 [Sphingomonas glacialis]
MSNTARYEVILVPSEMSLTSSEWTWRRFESDSDVSAQGSRHPTLPACFAEVRDHAKQFGPGTVAVNLRGDDAPPAPTAEALVPNREGARSNRLAPKALLRRRSALRG